jgi:hypothetical protein
LKGETKGPHVHNVELEKAAIQVGLKSRIKGNGKFNG